YNYLLSKVDSIGLSYRLTAYHYQNEPQAIRDQAINLVYARKITRRLALQINGGPQITNYRVPVAGQKQTVAGNGGVSLNYAFENGEVSTSYIHGLSAGSGVLIGS